MQLRIGLGLCQPSERSAGHRCVAAQCEFTFEQLLGAALVENQ